MTDILGLPAGALEGLDEADVQRVLHSPVPDITAGYLKALRRLQREAAGKILNEDWPL